ncbi:MULTISPECIES: class D sortase [unclassified Enterococcus]|uniref:class D sortase n=1 Tax=unclassified Enterococcus TaxID=2608891 RepID=UPI0013EC9C72|nr:MULTISPECIES: class D sortase [unclassified Enterococcus]
MYIVGQPVIHFATSSLQLFLLSDVPEFDKKQQVFTEIEEKEVKKDENNELSSTQIAYPKGGEQYGKIIIDSLKIDVPLYYGDTDEILRQGAGQYMGSVYPGERGTTLIGGHNIDEFGLLIGSQVGDVVSVKTSYANYLYQVKKIIVRRYDDREISQLIDQKQKPTVMLYTCYPVDSLGMTDERLFVICDLIDGPMINPNK